MYEQILVATDGSEHARRAAEHAVDVAARYDARLHAIYVVETRTAYDSAIVSQEEVRENLRSVGEEALANVSNLADEAGVRLTTTIEEGVPGEQILAYIEANDIDLVYVGERGHSAFETILLGSTAEAVLYGTDRPVTVV